MISRYRTDRENHPSSQSYTMGSTPHSSSIQTLKEQIKKKKWPYFITTTEDDFCQKIS